jgi:hypothetical protein
MNFAQSGPTTFGELPKGAPFFRYNDKGKVIFDRHLKICNYTASRRSSYGPLCIIKSERVWAIGRFGRYDNEIPAKPEPVIMISWPEFLSGMVDHTMLYDDIILQATACAKGTWDVYLAYEQGENGAIIDPWIWIAARPGKGRQYTRLGEVTIK